jgi:hypothetical protein
MVASNMGLNAHRCAELGQEDWPKSLERLGHRASALPVERQ